MSEFVIKSRPSLTESEPILFHAVSKRLYSIIVCRCRVDYRGRSSSKLDWGDRVVMVKPDGSVLVHRKTGHNAVNWQPPGAFISVSVHNGNLIIRADRRKPREILIVVLSEVMFVSTFSLSDDALIDMVLTEEELYSVLISHSDLIEDGFRISAEQKDLGGGKADIIGYDKNGIYTVVEVKKVAADVSAVKQLYKYVSGMRKTSQNIRAILLAPTIKPAAKKFSKTLAIDYRPIDIKKCADIYIKTPSSGASRLDRHL